jgi:GNAT superfamily N-acetyltransferase
MDKVYIRLATLDDADRIAELADQLGYPTTVSDMAQRLAELFQQANHAVYVAARSEEEIYGWIHLYVYRSLLSPPMAKVGGIVVDQAWRDQGIGQHLMRKAEDWGRAHGCEAVYLKTNVVREAAHAFYERLGYRNLKSQHVFRKDL